MKTMVTVLVAGVCLVTGRALGAEGETPSPPVTTEDMVLLHRWPGVQVLGFNSQGRLLAYDGARQVFESHDLTAPKAAVTGWNDPEGEKFFSAAFSPDGRTLVTVAETGREQSRIRFWDSATGAATGPAMTWTNVGSLAFSPDGKTLAGVGGGDGSVQLWNVTNREALARIPLPTAMEVGWMGIRFSPDGRFVATESGFTTLHVWNVAAGRFLGASPVENMYTAISPDWKLALGTRFGDAGQAPQTELLDFTDPEKPRPATRNFPKETMDVLNTAAFSADGRLMALNLRDNTARLWDTLAGRMVAHPAIHAGRLVRLMLSPDDRLLLAQEPDPTRRNPLLNGSIRLWDVAGGRPLGSPQPFTGMVRDISFDGESRFLVLSLFSEVQIWKLPAVSPAAGKPREPPAPASQAGEGK